MNMSYENIETTASLAPWNNDPEFLAIYDKIKGHTLVDKYRCYELWNLVGQCGSVEGALLEVGVWRGGTGALICRRAQLNNTGQTVYLADTFCGVVKASDKDEFYRGGEHMDTSLEIVGDLLTQKVGVANYKLLRGIFPEETSQFIAERRLSFVHIDVDVYQSAKDVFQWVWKRLSVGGIVVFDDYGFQSCTGVTALVEEMKQEKDRLFLYNLNGHGIFIKTKDAF